MKKKLALFFSLIASLASCGNSEGKLINQKAFDDMQSSSTKTTNSMIDTLTIGGGCFWCVEAQLQQLEGVTTVKSGYSGGTVKNPTYKEVCTGTTGHAEVIQVTFDTSVISLDEILAAFWQAHNPTQLNRQGNDVGTQYRSVIFYRNDEQKVLAENYKKKLNDEKVYDKPVVTETARVRPEGSEVLKLLSDNSKARNLMGWRPTVDLDVGLRRMIEFVDANRDHYRPENYTL